MKKKLLLKLVKDCLITNFKGIVGKITYHYQKRDMLQKEKQTRFQTKP